MNHHLPESFWDSGGAELAHIRDTARARRVGPDAVLGNCLAFAAATVPPHVALPPIVGGRASLNVGVAVIGSSGAGKGASTAVARNAFAWPHIPEASMGSGEGVARTFRPQGTKDDEPNPVTSAIFTAAEIDTLAAISSRQGATISAELRKLWSGEQLGFANAGKDTRCLVQAHSYRAAIVIGVQELRAGALLDGADGGLPQRFLWVPFGDPEAPDEQPATPTARPFTTPSWFSNGTTPVDLIVPEIAVTEIRAHRRAVLRETPGIDPLDGHLLLARLKTAAALMALGGRSVVSDEDWELAGQIIEVSNSTRARCVRAIADKARSINVGRALAAAERDEVISDRRHQRCRRGILRVMARLPDHTSIPANDLRRSLKSDVRDCFDPVITELLAEGSIFPAHSEKGNRYQRSTGDHRSTASDLQEQGVDHGSPVDLDATTRPNPSRAEHHTPQQTKPEPTVEAETASLFDLDDFTLSHA